MAGWMVGEVVSFTDILLHVLQALPALVRAVPDFPPPFQTTASLPCVVLGLCLTDLTSPQKTRYGWGHGGSASWGLEQPHSSSPSPSWATPSASQVRGTARLELCLHPPIAGDTRAVVGDKFPVFKL